MHDPDESLEDTLQRLEAKLAAIIADRDEYEERFLGLAYDQSVKARQGITQEDLDAVMENTGVLDRVIEQLECEGRSV